MSYPIPFKRLNVKTGKLFDNLYVRFECRGKSYLFCCKTVDPKLAKIRARQYYDAIVGENFHLATSMRAMSEIPTLYAVCEAYKGLPLPVGHPARKKNIQCLGHVLAAAGLSMDSQVDRLSERVAITFQKKSLEEDYSVFTINSRLRSAASIFSRRAMTGYRALGLLVSDSWAQPFCKVSSLPEPEIRRRTPGPLEVATAHFELAAYPDYYRAFLLAAYMGLRAIEIGAARWDWIEGDILYVGGREYTSKNKKWGLIKISTDVQELLNRSPRDGDFICGKYPAEVAQRLAGMLKSLCGFTTYCATHSLRGLYGSIIAHQSGLWAAKNALRHSSQATTDKHYARALSVPEGISVLQPQVQQEFAS